MRGLRKLHCVPLRDRRQHGFSLVELMVTVAVLAIVAGIAAPSMTDMVHNSRLTGQANELVSALQLARSEAVRSNRTVEICGTSDGSTCLTATGPTSWTRWIVRTTTPANQGVVLQSGAIPANLKVRATNFPVKFRGNGFASTSSASINVCSPVAGMSSNQRVVNFAGAGRISVDKVNGNGGCPQ